MSISNIIDNRSVDEDNRCDVVFEINCDDIIDEGISKETESFTEWTSNTTVYSAIMQGMQFNLPVTLHLYDPGMISSAIGILIEQRVHPKMKPEPINFSKIPTTLWKPY